MLFDTYDIPSHLLLRHSFSRRRNVGIGRYKCHRRIDPLGMAREVFEEIIRLNILTTNLLRSFNREVKFSLTRIEMFQIFSHCRCCRCLCAVIFVSIIGAISVSIANSFLLNATISAEEFVFVTLVCFKIKNIL